MIDDPFHQTVSVFFNFDKTYTSGQLNRMLKELGAKLHYDVYSFEREDKGPIWQSESLIYMVTNLDANELDAQESLNKLELQFPLATLGAEQISKFAIIVEKISEAFGVQPRLDGSATTAEKIIEQCDNLVSDLMGTWGEEPGSEALRIIIESHY